MKRRTVTLLTTAALAALAGSVTFAAQQDSSQPARTTVARIVPAITPLSGAPHSTATQSTSAAPRPTPAGHAVALQLTSDLRAHAAGSAPSIDRLGKVYLIYIPSTPTKALVWAYLRGATRATWSAPHFHTVTMHPGSYPNLEAPVPVGDKVWLGFSAQKGIVSYIDGTHQTITVRAYNRWGQSSLTAHFLCDHYGNCRGWL